MITALSGAASRSRILKDNREEI